jgi:hypothetical protein
MHGSSDQEPGGRQLSVIVTFHPDRDETLETLHQPYLLTGCPRRAGRSTQTDSKTAGIPAYAFQEISGRELSPADRGATGSYH